MGDIDLLGGGSVVSIEAKFKNLKKKKRPRTGTERDLLS
jgi:hypothetical protein